MKKQDETEVLQAWQEAVQAEVKTRPWLASLFLQKGNQLFTRFVTFYARLTAVKQQTRRRLAVGVGTAALMLALSSAPTPAYAATITVGPGCTLVQAIQSANTDTSVGGVCTTGTAGLDIINLPLGGTYSYNTAFGTYSALPNITSAITIEANGATIQRTSGAPNMRIITVTPTGNLTLNNATITGGNGVSNGGGIFNDSGTTTLNNSTVSGNTASSRGGGILTYGGTTTLNNSTVSGNTGNFGGGGICNIDGTTTLNNSTVTGNTAPSGGGIYTYGYNSPSTTTLNNSTVSRNTASNRGGGIYNASSSNPSTTTLVRTIISGNNAPNGAEISNGGTFNANSHNVLGHNALTNAQAFGEASPAWLGVSDVNATSDDTNATALASILYTTLDGSGVPIPTLADNGGPTLTHALVTGSPAIDIALAGDCAGTPINGLDQRGVARSQDGNASGAAACDAGAVEMGQLQCGIQAAIEPFPLTFAQASNVLVNVTNDGADLDCVRVTEIGHDHPNATSSVSNMALETGRYWQIAGYQNSISATPPTTDFTVDLTLPFAGADVNGDNRACKWLDGGGPGFGWDCGDDADNEEVMGVSVTRLNYTGGFSDWAVGDEVGPTAVSNLSTQTNTPNQNAYIPLLASLLTLLSGAWLWLRRPTR